MLDRRTFLKGMAALGGLAATRPLAALADARLGGLMTGATRASAIDAANGLLLVHADLHNHSLISGDAAGDPYTALGQMRAAGIDVACLTEHAISGKGHGELTCPGWEQGGGHTVEGINESDWEAMAVIADDGYDPGAFVSFRAFEWSTPTVGHLNVWFSREFTDALREHAFLTPAAAAEIDRIAPVPSEIVDVFEDAPDIATMRYFYEWLASDPDRPIFGGGNDAIASFNHPNEFGNFENWLYDPNAAPRIVQFEAFNTGRDFFWQRRDEGMPNPFNACLNAGFRVGFIGVSDEHGTVFGQPGLGRGGLWVSSLDRAGVRAALSSRRTFATLEDGLRLDATANGVPMGSAIGIDQGTLSIALDVDNGPGWSGRPLLAEVLRPGDGDPTLVATVPIASGTPAAFDIPVDRAQGDWLFLRITDPTLAPHELSIEPYTSHGGAVAYASPWFLNAS